jgi:hypothetical protein
MAKSGAGVALFATATLALIVIFGARHPERRPVVEAALLGLSLIFLMLLLALLRMARAIRALACTVVILAALCGIAAIVQEAVLGGSASNGKVETGRYYVGSHGSYRQISPRTYRIAFLFDLGLFAFWPTMFTLPALLGLARRSPQVPQNTPALP